jgi:Tol biopolymer transport system component
VKLIGSGRPLRLTNDPAPDVAPAWSPDGGSIAFVRFDAGKARIMLIPALGGTERELVDFDWTVPGEMGLQLLTAKGVSWSPDGRWLVVSGKEAAEKLSSLWLVSFESGEKRQLTVSPAANRGDYGAAFSPDGRTVAFVRNTANETNDLYVLPLAGNLSASGEPRRLTKDNRIISGIAWTADGREIVFSSDRGGARALWRMAISGSGEPRRLSVGEYGLSPAISRQGDRLVYSQAIADSNIWRVNLSDLREPAAPLIASTRADLNAQYSPDGKKIVFCSDRAGSMEVWVCDADGANAVQLVQMGYSGSPRWSPDSQRIAFDANATGHWQIYQVSAQGGRPQRMTNSVANDDTKPSWSQDGKWIYFGSNRSGGSQSWQIWKMPSGGGEAVQVTRHGGFQPFESKDGKTIYYTKLERVSQLWKVPAEGGEESQILDLVSNSFAVTRGGLYFILRQGLHYFDFSTGIAKPILTPPKPTTFGLTVSPDEHWLLYAQFDHAGSDLMLVENFR